MATEIYQKSFDIYLDANQGGGTTVFALKMIPRERSPFHELTQR